jgi:hypothetical protein
MNSRGRFEELQRIFRSYVPSRKIGGTRKKHIAMAAGLQQVLEMAVIENACGAHHDMRLLRQMKSEVKAHLASANVQLPKEVKK